MRFLSALVFVLITIGTLKAQQPVADFNLPPISCTDEQFTMANTSTGASTFKWDFCQGDLLVTPIIENNILSSGVSSALGLKIVEDNGTYFGFATSSSTNSLYRFEFDNDLLNNPTVIDMGDLGVLRNPEGLDIVKEGANWIGLVGHSLNGGGEIIRVIWTDLTLTPIAEEITNFGVSSRIREVQIIKQGSDIIAVMPYYNGSTLLRVNFKNSLLNTPLPADIYQSASLNNVQFPIGMSVVKQASSWKVVLGSVVTKTISIYDFGPDILSVPVEVKSQAFSTFNNLSKVKVIAEGDDFFCFVSTSAGPIHLLNLYTLAPTDIFNEIPISSPPTLSGIDLIKIKSKHFLFGVNTNMSRLIYESSCSVSKDYSDTTDPIINYMTNGNFPITLTALNSNNNYNSVTKSITISPSQAPQLTAQIIGNCLTSPISFAGQQLSGNITSWNWDFGDGSGTSTLQNDTYTYASAGTYQVKLNVTDVNGCNNLNIDTVIVYEEPMPDFTFPAGTLCMNNPVAFINSTTGESGPAVTWTWDFNGEGTSMVKEPSFTFLTSGNKTVTLTSSIPGCANVTQQTIFIEEAPTTNFSFNNVCNTQTTTFTDLTLGTNLTAWNWDFGDGNFSTDQNPTHIYATPGKYPVTLTVDNNLGCSTSITDTVYNHAVPVVNFTNDLPCSSSPIQFIDQSIVQDAGIIVWEWDFGDGKTSTDRNPQHTYGQTGDFTVQLKAYSQFGCVDSTESIVTVIQGPEVDFDWDKGCLGETTSFTDLTNSFGQPITSWTWLIDNTVFTEQNPQYSFGTSGTFTIQLSVTTNNLCAQTILKEITVESTPITTFDYSEACNDDIVTFYDTTPPTIATRQWRIDGIMNSTDSIMAESLVPGNYMVSLATTSTSGCNSTLTKNININGSPMAQYTVTANYGATPLTVQFTNESTGADTYFWDFGDASNSSSTEINPQFIFTDIGIYNVTLIANGGQNCADTTIQIIEVVAAVHGLSLDAITLLDGGSIALTLTNMGSYTYNEDNLQLVFTLDIGAEISELFATILYPQKTINYMPNITLGDLRNSKLLCAELQFINDIPFTILDKNCANLNNQDIITEAYPNPANDYINLSVVLPESGNVSITLIDRTGAVIMNDTFESAQQGLNNYTIDTTPYRSGLYIIKVETDNEVKKIKMIIDR